MFKIITICFFLSTLVKGADPDGFPEVNRAVRAKEATNKLNDRKQMALIFVKGMTWPSCAIGIRVKLSKLSFVDRGRYKRGVDMDVKNQLLSVALKKGQLANFPAIAEAIDKAGYVPVEWFKLDKGKLVTTPFAKPVSPSK